MAVCSKHHLELDANGVGKCSVPMWSGGVPAGFCDEPAYGKPLRGGGYGYIPGLACPEHGGPKKPEDHKPIVSIPMDQWHRLVVIIEGWFPTHSCDDGDCLDCQGDAELKAIIASVGVQNE